jgi:hypothetical protein
MTTPESPKPQESASPSLNSNARLYEVAARVREEVLDIHRSFAPMRKLLGESGLLALNASVACARLGAAGRTFATVARDLHTTSRDLSTRIDEVEGAFHHAARLVVAWTLAEERAETLRKTVRAMQGRREKVSNFRGLPLWTPEAGARWRERALDRTSPEAERHLARLLLGEREKVLEATFELAYLIQGLERHVDRIRWAAVRQTRYLRVLASIERAHLNDQGSAVDAVVVAMESLDTRIAALEELARDKVLGLMLHTRAFQRAQGLELRTAEAS